MHRICLAVLASVMCFSCTQVAHQKEPTTLSTTQPVTETPSTQPESWVAITPASQPATEPASQPTAATLKVGDAAPALTPAKWIKGEPVAKLETGKMYVVEFWATWCGPCKQSIPHLTELAAKFKDVTFIGQDVREPDLAAVEPFVKEMGEKMEYHVALDDAEHGRMDQAWMAAAAQEGIPTAFLVDKDTKIAWIGHPMELEPILKDVAAGTFDAQKFAAAGAAKAAAMEKLQQAMQNDDPDKVLTLVDEISKSNPEMAKELRGLKYETLLQKKDTPAAMALAKQMVADANANAEELNAIAWSMVDPDNPLDKPDLALAEKAAARANELTNGANAPILDTLAHVYAAQGHLDKAVATETRAVEKNSDPELKDDLAKTLEGYQSQTPRNPARDNPSAPDARGSPRIWRPSPASNRRASSTPASALENGASAISSNPRGSLYAWLKLTKRWSAGSVVFPCRDRRYPGPAFTHSPSIHPRAAESSRATAAGND